MKETGIMRKGKRSQQQGRREGEKGQEGSGKVSARGKKSDR